MEILTYITIWLIGSVLTVVAGIIIDKIEESRTYNGDIIIYMVIGLFSSYLGIPILFAIYATCQLYDNTGKIGEWFNKVLIDNRTVKDE